MNLTTDSLGKMIKCSQTLLARYLTVIGTNLGGRRASHLLAGRDSDYACAPRPRLLHLQPGASGAVLPPVRLGSLSCMHDAEPCMGLLGLYWVCKSALPMSWVSSSGTGRERLPAWSIPCTG